MERRSAQPQRLRRLVSVRASAVGAGGVGRLGLHVLLDQSADRIAGERDRAAQRLCDLPFADLAQAGSPYAGRETDRRGGVSRAPGVVQHRLAADQRHAEGARSQGRAPHRSGIDFARRRDS